jgi:hypothetical protein
MTTREAMQMRSRVLSAVLVVMSVPACALADTGSAGACERQVHQKQEALQVAIRRHGEQSAQAEQARQALQQARARCEHP